MVGTPPDVRSLVRPLCPPYASLLCAVHRRIETERQALPVEIARIASAAVLARNFAIEAQRGAVVDAGGVLAKMLRQQRATQAARHLRVPDRGVHFAMTGERMCVQVA